jgi:6-phosphogluconolactonase
MRYLTRNLPKAVVTIALALGGAAALPAVAAAHHRRAEYVYVNDNTEGTNTVSGFRRQPGGGLTALPGSPFRAGGAGTGTGLASQGAIQVSSDSRYVVAVDAGSNQLSALRIESNGALKLIRRGVVSSGGIQPVSVAEHDGIVYVANAGAGGSNYAGFTLSAGGDLRPLPGSAVPLPDSAQPGDVLFNSVGTVVVGTRVGTSQIDSFKVRGNGRLTAALGSPFAAQSEGPFGSEFRPTDPTQLFVSNAHAGPGHGTVSAFGVASDGALSSIGGSPFVNGQTAPCWVEITHDGAFLFAVNTASGTISRYEIAPGGALTLLGSTPITSHADPGAVDARLSADGRTLYVNESKAAAIGEFGVDGGRLTEQGSVSLPAGAAAAGIAIK